MSRPSDELERPAPSQPLHEGGRPTLPRRLHRAVLRLLRPAESAARRLILALACGLSLPPPRPRKPAPVKERSRPAILRGRIGTGIILPAGMSAAAGRAAVAAAMAASAAATATSSAAVAAGMGSAVSAAVGLAASERPLLLPLTDRRKVWTARRRPSWVPTGHPRIGVPGITPRAVLPSRLPPAPDDLIDAARLRRRIAALAAALDDLPGQALRFARWRARQERAVARGQIRRLSPLRPGRPPGGRLSRYDPGARRSCRVREVDEILAHAHALALYALDPHDTS